MASSIHQREDRACLDPEKLVVRDLSIKQLLEHILTTFPGSDRQYVDKQLTEILRRQGFSQIGASSCHWSIVSTDGEKMTLCVSRNPIGRDGSTAPSAPRRVYEIFPGQPHPAEREKKRIRGQKLSEQGRIREVSISDLAVNLLQNTFFEKARAALCIPDGKGGENDVDVVLVRGGVNEPDVYIETAVYTHTGKPVRLDLPDVRERVLEALDEIKEEDIEVQGVGSLHLGKDGLIHFQDEGEEMTS